MEFFRCAWCGEMFSWEGRGVMVVKFCCPEHQRRSDSRRAEHARRARLRGAKVERFESIEIFERDRWICQLCLRPVRRDLFGFDGYHPEMPSLDHVVPLSRGGDHTRANSQTAHHYCNAAKSNRGGPEQLRLVG